MSQETTHEWLQYYLRDHFAGATAGVNLFARVSRGHSNPQVRTEVGSIYKEVVQEREILRAILSDLGIRRVSGTMVMAVVGERVGRLKPNGALRKRSIGADVLELEALAAAVQVKACMWGTLLGLAAIDSRLETDQMKQLQDQAIKQRHTLTSLHALIIRSVL